MRFTLLVLAIMLWGAAAMAKSDDIDVRFGLGEGAQYSLCGMNVEMTGRQIVPTAACGITSITAGVNYYLRPPDENGINEGWRVSAVYCNGLSCILFDEAGKGPYLGIGHQWKNWNIGFFVPITNENQMKNDSSYLVSSGINIGYMFNK